MNGDVQLVASVPDAFADLVEGTTAGHTGGPFSLFLSGGPTAEKCYRRLGTRGPGSTGGPSMSTSVTSAACPSTTPTPTTG